MLLQEKWQESLSFGRDSLLKNPKNEYLAGYFVQASRHDLAVEDPLAALSEDVKSSVFVTASYIDFLRHRRPPQDWWEASREALKKHPEDPTIIRHAAEADLEEILESEEFQRTKRLSSDECKRITLSTRALASLWDEIRSREAPLRPENSAVCCNLIFALHSLDDLQSALDYARQGLEIAPDDIEIIKRAAIVAVDAREDEFARELLKKSPPGPDATVSYFRLYTREGNWEGLSELYKSQRENIPDVDRSLIITTGKLADLKVSPPEDYPEKVKAIAEEASNDARASIVVSAYARMENLQEISEFSFQKALECMGLDGHVSSRMMVAIEASRRERWSIAADLLNGHTIEDKDSFELRTLATALSNDKPIRQRAIDFYLRLPPEIRNSAFYLHAEGLLHFSRGAISEAEEKLRDAIKEEPLIRSFLALYHILRRQGLHAEIQSIAEHIDLDTSIGTETEKLSLAELVKNYGNPDLALAYAYKVYTASKNIPEVSLLYFSLLMSNPSNRFIPEVESVGIDTWVQIENADEEKFSFMIEEGESHEDRNIFNPNHPMAVSANGLRKGEHFSITPLHGKPQRWRIIQIKHKYLHTLHDIMENFEKRFPNAGGFRRIKTRGEDIQPILDQVREAAEQNRKLADLYLTHRIPAGMIANLLRRDSISFYEYIRALGHSIETCTGIDSERISAHETIQNHRSKDAVLDTYTAWTVATMNAFDVLVSVFGNIYVPSTVISELATLRDRDENAGTPSMTVAWMDGAFVRQEHTEESSEARRRLITDQIGKIEDFCRVEPACAPDAPSELASFLTDTFGPNVLDAPYLAGGERILISEDMHFRHLSKASVGVESIWLQPIFSLARSEGKITSKRFSKLVAHLAIRRHGHVSLDSAVLYDSFLDDEDNELEDFQALANFIGVKNADFRAHYRVTERFLEFICGSPKPLSLKARKATGYIIDRLIRHRNDDWALILASLKHVGTYELSEYIDRWIVGHFLPISAVREAEIQIIGYSR